MKLRLKKKLLTELETIKDFRIHQGKVEFKLSKVLFLIIFAMIKGTNTFVEQHDWIEANRKNKTLLKLFGKKEIEAPCSSTLHRIAINIDNNALENVFRSYFDKYVTKKNLAIDGKWLNGSKVTGQYINKNKKIILNIVDKNTKLCIGHKFIGIDKKSEGYNGLKSQDKNQT